VGGGFGHGEWDSVGCSLGHDRCIGASAVLGVVFFGIERERERKKRWKFGCVIRFGVGVPRRC